MTARLRTSLLPRRQRCSSNAHKALPKEIEDAVKEQAKRAREGVTRNQGRSLAEELRRRADEDDFGQGLKGEGHCQSIHQQHQHRRPR